MHNFYDYTQSTGFYNETWYLKRLLSLILCAMWLDLRMQISVQKNKLHDPVWLVNGCDISEDKRSTGED